jgi:hypothetical protein
VPDAGPSGQRCAGNSRPRFSKDVNGAVRLWPESDPHAIVCSGRTFSLSRRVFHRRRSAANVPLLFCQLPLMLTPAAAAAAAPLTLPLFLSSA